MRWLILHFTYMDLQTDSLKMFKIYEVEVV